MTTLDRVAATSVTGGRDLTPLFAPRSVVIVGASDTPGKFGYEVARSALRGEHRRSVHLLNTSGTTVAGRPTVTSFAEIGETPDLVVLATPARTLPGVVDEALAAGARAFLGLTAGVDEDTERELAARIREADAVLVGPNCIGLADAEAELDLYAWGRFNTGSVAVLSHSGGLGMDIGRGISDAGLGISRIVSMGNCTDLQPADLIRDLVHHEPTNVIAVYCESLGEGRDFLRAAAEARNVGKPVVALVAEPSDATARAAMTHTRALLSDGRVVSAAYRAAGIIQVHSIADLLGTVRVLAAPRRPQGRRIGVISEGGGAGIIAADAMARAGLDVPEFSSALQERLGSVVKDNGSAANPIDTGAGGTVSVIAAVAETVMDSGEVDAVVVTGLGSTSDFYVNEALRSPEESHPMLGSVPEGQALESMKEFAVNDHNGAGLLVDAAARTGVPAYGVFFDSSLTTMRILDEGGCPVFRSVDSVAEAVARAIPRDDADAGVPLLPEPGESPPAVDYFTVRKFLEKAGIGYAQAECVRSIDEALVAAKQIGYPVVLKALASMHKSDEGGVALGLRSDSDLIRAFQAMEHLSSETYSVEQMVIADDAAELILGAQVDHQFGPVVMVGIGGVYSELLSDVAVDLAPIDVDGAERLIRTLRGSSLLTGHRGRPALAIRAAAEALSKLSLVIASSPGIADIEINPLLVSTDRAVGLDARAVRTAANG